MVESIGSESSIWIGNLLSRIDINQLVYPDRIFNFKFITGSYDYGKQVQVHELTFLRYFSQYNCNFEKLGICIQNLKDII